MKYRLIQKAELDKLLLLYQHLNPHDPQVDKDTYMDVWRQFMDDPKISCIVAEEDGILIASCTLIIVPNLTRGGRPYGLIENVVTHADYRNRGIGKQILHYALDLAWKEDSYKVMLLTSRKDEKIMQFYESAGFLRGVKTGFVAKPEV
ncbi:MAG: GNAT family N-acetyltransferase [Anaerolineaceae bacterium]|nr:GNAT family N-acetyltransferase [Anaerolineaceae bacterium]